MKKKLLIASCKKSPSMYALNAGRLFSSSNKIFVMQLLISVLTYKKYVLNWVKTIIYYQKQFIIS